MGYWFQGRILKTERSNGRTRHATPSLIFLAALIALLLGSPLLTASSVFAETASPKEQKVTFNFVDVELPAITKFISEITKKNFIFDERVKGKITIIAPSKLSVTDAYTLFVSVLELKGFTVIPSGVDAYKIVPVSEAKQKGVKIGTSKTAVNDSYSVRLIKLKSISTEEAVKLLQPVVSKDGYLSAFGPGNMLLIMDSGLNIEKVLSIIDSIDQPSRIEEPDMVFLKNAGAEAVAKIVNDGMSRKAGPAVQTANPEVAKAVADTRLNALILFGDRGTRDAMKSLIAHLDVASPASQGKINVYFLENADATDLAKVLESMLKGAPQKPGTAAQVTPFEAITSINVTADKATNALVITASPGDYQNFIQIIKQLDRRRRQVYVEAMIAEVSIDKLNALGSKWRGAMKVDGNPIAVGGLGDFSQNTDGFGTVQSLLTGMAGFSLAGAGGSYTLPAGVSGLAGGVTSIPKLAAIFSLNDFKGVVNVLSTPQLLTADNKESEIMVGQNVPFISQMQATPLTTGTTTNSYLPLTSIDRQDVGIKLKLTPQITEGNYVKLDVYQEISAVTSTNSQVGPTTDKRSTKTSVVVRDKDTVVIGGLMQERTDESVTKVPLLGDIPILGWAFTQKSVEKKKTNLLVFITPRIVKEADNLTKITNEKQKELNIAGASESNSEHEIVVKFKQGVSEETSLTLIAGKGSTVTGYLKGLKIYQVRLKAGQTAESAVREFSSLPEVEFAEPSSKLK